MQGTSRPENVSTKQLRIAELARQAPDMCITTLAHHMDIDWLKEAVQRTRKDGAPGVDGQTAEEYARNLEANLNSLLQRAKSGSYRAPPVRRAHIPKGNGETRPIGIPTFEDKVLQRAVVMLLEPVYEQDFYDFSYGFRPYRSAHHALDSFEKQMMAMGGGWVLEVDIRKFFDTLDHRHVQELVRQRVNDGVLCRLIGKWLNAGVQEDGSLSYPDSGSPQGGVISPLLANIYLHEVLDRWFEQEVKPRLGGPAFLVRFADDFVIGFGNEGDARRVMNVLPKRFGRYGLTLHPDKTRLVPFRRPNAWGGPPPGTFNFLGFTLYWGAARKGGWVLRRRTAKERLRRALKAITAWCKANRHSPLRLQHATLSRKVRGHCNYYGHRAELHRLDAFVYWTKRIWRRALARRSQQGMPWERFKMILKRFPLPEPRALVVPKRLIAAKP